MDVGRSCWLEEIGIVVGSEIWAWMLDSIEDYETSLKKVKNWQSSVWIGLLQSYVGVMPKNQSPVQTGDKTDKQYVSWHLTQEHMLL